MNYFGEEALFASSIAVFCGVKSVNYSKSKPMRFNGLYNVVILFCCLLLFFNGSAQTPRTPNLQAHDKDRQAQETSKLIERLECFKRSNLTIHLDNEQAFRPMFHYLLNQVEWVNDHSRIRDYYSWQKDIPQNYAAFLADTLSGRGPLPDFVDDQTRTGIGQYLKQHPYPDATVDVVRIVFETMAYYAEHLSSDKVVIAFDKGGSPAFSFDRKKLVLRINTHAISNQTIEAIIKDIGRPTLLELLRNEGANNPFHYLWYGYGDFELNRFGSYKERTDWSAEKIIATVNDPFLKIRVTKTDEHASPSVTPYIFYVNKDYTYVLIDAKYKSLVQIGNSRTAYESTVAGYSPVIGHTQYPDNDCHLPPRNNTAAKENDEAYLGLVVDALTHLFNHPSDLQIAGMMVKDVAIEFAPVVVGGGAFSLGRSALKAKTVSDLLAKYGKPLKNRFDELIEAVAKRRSGAIGGITNVIPEGSFANHLFVGVGKLADNPANRALLLKISNGKPIGVDPFGKSWYMGVDGGGKSVYTYTQNGVVKGAGYATMTRAEMIAKFNLK